MSTKVKKAVYSILVASLLGLAGYVWLMSAATGTQYLVGRSRWHVPNGGAWRIDHSLLVSVRWQLNDAEKAYETTSRPSAASRHPAWDLSSYNVQVQGRLFKGKRVVLLQGICDETLATLRFDLDKQFHLLNDGGDCIFHAVFDPAKDQFEWFQFGGEG